MTCEIRNDDISFLKMDLKVLVKQICLMDQEIFKNVTIEEIESFNWNNKIKKYRCPHLLRCIKQFNMIHMWVINEILKLSSTGSKIIGRFIKLGKKLTEYRNYQSAYAVKSALDSAPIHRLEQSWNQLDKRYRVWHEDLCQLFNIDDNFQRLRQEMGLCKLPSVPYLGLYLGDLTGLEAAFPKVNGLVPANRCVAMSHVFELIVKHQKVDYNVHKHPGIQKYLLSQEYIEELQNVIIDTLFYKSKALQPEQSNNSVGGGSGDTSSSASGGSNNTASTTSSSAGVTITTFSVVDKFNRSHRKSLSLGTDEIGQYRKISDQERQFQNLPPYAGGTMANSNDDLNDDSAELLHRAHSPQPVHQSSPKSGNSNPGTPQFSRHNVSEEEQQQSILINLLDDSVVLRNSTSPPLGTTNLAKSISVRSVNPQYSTTSLSPTLSLKNPWQSSCNSPGGGGDDGSTPSAPITTVSITPLNPDQLLYSRTQQPSLVLQGCLSCQHRPRSSYSLSSANKNLVKLLTTDLDCFLTLHAPRTSKPRSEADFKTEPQSRISLSAVKCHYDNLKTNPRIVVALPQETVLLRPLGSSTNETNGSVWPDMEQWWSAISGAVAAAQSARANVPSSCTTLQLQGNKGNLINLEDEFTRL